MFGDPDIAAFRFRDGLVEKKVTSYVCFDIAVRDGLRV